jgi:hypothetical protein
VVSATDPYGRILGFLDRRRIRYIEKSIDLIVDGTYDIRRILLPPFSGILKDGGDK